MKNNEKKKEPAWGVEYVFHGKRTISIDYSRHSTPQQAIDAFIERNGGSWEEYEKQGAKVVQKEIILWREKP